MGSKKGTPVSTAATFTVVKVPARAIRPGRKKKSKLKRRK
jgi:hypothetical protein